MSTSLHLLRSFLARDLASRYRGSALSWAWYILNPLFMLSVFTLVFSSIFGMRWGSAGGNQVLFAFNVFAGLIVNNFFAETWQRAAQSVLGQPSLVKKVSFPLYLLPMVMSLSALAHFSFGLMVLLIGMLLTSQQFDFYPLQAMLAIPPMFIFSMGIAWILAALTVYLRDLVQILGLLLSAMLFLSPVFYPMSQVPDKLQSYLLLNPISIPAESIRAAFMGGPQPPSEWLVGYWLSAILVFIFGRWLFYFLARGFADVL